MRGDVVLIDFPFTDARASKIRPALVIQNDADNMRRRKTIVAMITGNLRMSADPRSLLLDPATEEGALSGLHGPSLVSCGDLFTVEQDGIFRTLGHLPDQVLQRIDACLKAALGLS